MNNKSLKINYTAYLANNWIDIVKFHLECFKQSHIADIADNITFFAYPKNEDLTKLISLYGMQDNIKVMWNENNEYEYRAIRDLINNPFDINLYFHSKGTSKTNNNPLKKNVWLWNYYMSNYIIANHKKCIELLNDNDCVGVDFRTTPMPHFSGNFWWATKSHLERLKLNTDIENYKRFRMIYEMLLMLTDCKCVSLCESGGLISTNTFTIDKWKTIPVFHLIHRNRKCVVITHSSNQINNLTNHKNIDGVDFICVCEGNISNMIHGNWIIYQFPDRLSGMPYESKVKFLKSNLPRYFDYDEIFYTQDNNLNRIYSEIIRNNLTNEEYGFSNNKITYIHNISNDSIECQIFHNRLACNMINETDEKKALDITICDANTVIFSGCVVQNTANENCYKFKIV